MVGGRGRRGPSTAAAVTPSVLLQLPLPLLAFLLALLPSLLPSPSPLFVGGALFVYPSSAGGTGRGSSSRTCAASSAPLPRRRRTARFSSSSSSTSGTNSPSPADEEGEGHDATASQERIRSKADDYRCSVNKRRRDDATAVAVCRLCGRDDFPSRNALFRHLQEHHRRSSDGNGSVDTAKTAPGAEEATTTATTRRESFALSFSYHHDCYDGDGASSPPNGGDPLPSPSPSELAGTLLQEAFLGALRKELLQLSSQAAAAGSLGVGNSPPADVATVRPVGRTTQASAARLRPECLGQERDCAGAAGDVLAVSCEVVAAVPSSSSSSERGRADGDGAGETIPSEEGLLFCPSPRLLKLTNSELRKKLAGAGGVGPKLKYVHLNSCKRFVDASASSSSSSPLSSSSHFHAERSCTQLVYRYLLSVEWLPDAEALADFAAALSLSSSSSQQNLRFVPESFRCFKSALRDAQSPVLTRDDDGDDDAVDDSEQRRGRRHCRRAFWRFGALAYRRRRAWHNFSDPQLRGQASPNQEPIWRCLDRARVVGFVSTNGSAQQAVVLEFRGDGFVRQQIRRVVATAVAIAHGWLPPDAFAELTRSDVLVPTPCAPPGRLFLCGPRFHFEEMRTSGRTIFESDAGGPVREETSLEESLGLLQQSILAPCSAPDVVEAEKEWLRDLRENSAPATRKALPGIRDEELSEAKMDASTMMDMPESQVKASLEVPAHYEPVLRQLRRIVSNGEWPETSSARSAVIRGFDEAGSSEGEGQNRRGSFTIANPQLPEVPHLAGKNASVPLGNAIFPQLADLVFELESVLARQPCDQVYLDGGARSRAEPRRQASSHCAVNCNAEFTPHVDSGRGAGQSLSMIVGLGNYSLGGELMVEGLPHDIHYRPLEFDGWKLRHWTRPFKGERFSLVWFTPASMGPSIAI